MTPQSPEIRAFHGIIETAPEVRKHHPEPDPFSDTSRKGLPDMVPKICSFETCERPSKTRGFCDAHYDQFRKGQPLRKIRGYRSPVSERFPEHVQKTATCWLWTGGKDRDGYGRCTSDEGKSTSAHRVAYSLAFGEIPAGFEIDHRCLNIICVRPDHLRLATRKQNAENCGPQKNSSTGIRGVFAAAGGPGWRAVVGHKGQRIHLGTFSDIRDAEAAVVAKRLELFTHNELDRRTA